MPGEQDGPRTTKRSTAPYSLSYNASTNWVEFLHQTNGQSKWAVAQQRPEYVIPGTAFSTGTVNLGIRCRPHRDKGNLCLSAMTVTDLSPEPVQGGELLLPEYLCAISIRNEDVLLFDGHTQHATAQFYTAASPSLIHGVQRLSCIFYYRAGLAKCLPPDEELRRAQQRMSETW
jgi:hypothetical protein